MRRPAVLPLLFSVFIWLPQLLWSGTQAGAESPEAQFDKAVAYAMGTRSTDGKVTAEPNYVEAAKLFRKAADRGLPKAQRNLGELYQNGLGVNKDDVEAMKWFRKASDQGDPASQLAVGMMYATGRGVKKNPMEAVKWYRRSAEQGFALAQFVLGVAYELGIGGIVPDKTASELWYAKAAAQGFDPAGTAGQRPAGNVAPLKLPGDRALANLIAKVEPVYPPKARSDRIQDYVMFQVLIDSGGRIRDLKLVHGHPLLNDAAIESVKQWRFAPQLVNGQLTEVLTTITLNFRFE